MYAKVSPAGTSTTNWSTPFPSLSVTCPADEDEVDPDTECNDGLDNDGDGWVDTEDPACINPSTPLENDGFQQNGDQCNDGADNDFDGLTDSEDPNCLAAYDASEAF